MGKFMQKERHANDPKWLEGLDPFVEKGVERDVDAVVRNYNSDKGQTQDATYVKGGRGK